MRLKPRHLFAAAAAAVLTTAAATGDGTEDGGGKHQPSSAGSGSVRRSLSKADVDRHMSGASRLLQVPGIDDDKLQKIDIFRFAKILDSDAYATMGVEEGAERARRLWNEYIAWDVKLAFEMETDYLVGMKDVELSDILYAYLICSSIPNESARQRKEDIFRIIDVNLGNFVIDVKLDFIYQDVIHALQTVYNAGDETCFIGNMRLSVVAVVVGLDNVDVMPLNSFAKMRQGVVQDVLERAYPDRFGGGETNVFSGLNTTSLTDGQVGEDGLTIIDEDKKPGVSEGDLTGNEKVDGSDSSLDVVMCPGVHVEELGRLNDKIRNFMLRETSDGTNYVASLVPWKGATSMSDQPARVQFWEKVFNAGIDSSIGCGPTIDRIDTVLTEPKEPGDPVGVSVTLSDVADGEGFDADVACVLGLIFALSALPQVCSLEIKKKTYALNDQAQSLVQGGGGGTQGKRPFWDAGITGNGQVVAVSDTGLDYDHCHFWDSVVGMRPDGNYDTTRRKVIQYDPFVDANEDEGGHGTHVAGTIAGHVARDGRNEMTGKADGVAKDAKLAFIDCSSGGSSLAIPGDKNRLLNTGTKEGARIHSASWGATLNPYRYDTMSSEVDSYLASNWDMLMLVAAGNSGRGDKEKSLGSPATAKNVLAIGAGQSAGPDISPSQRGPDYIADFSSEGPTSDGRIAPQLIGPGQSILSSNAIPSIEGECEPDDANDFPRLGKGSAEGVTYKAGTSMATPAVAGAAALVRQYFVDGYFPNGVRNSTREASIDPSGTLVKAVLINGGQLMEGKDNGGDVTQSTMYDNVQGFGRVSLLDSLKLQGENNFNVRVVDRQTVPDGNRLGYRVRIQQNICTGQELRATLVWADPAGASGCVRCLVNDLDLTLTNEQTGEIYYPNGKDSKDSVNNVERIIVPANKQINGDSWVATVRASNLDRPSQQFSLVMSGCFTPGSDIGIEKPGSANVIGSWLAASVALLASTYLFVFEMGQLI